MSTVRQLAHPTSEAVIRTVPLGVRPWDLVTGSPAEPGLTVTCRTVSGQVLTSVLTQGGVYVLSGIPALGASERSDADEAYWYHPPASVPVTVQIDDPLGRYLPLSVEAVLPHRGLLSPNCPMPGSAAAVIPLFSAPGRLSPTGTAAVRAQLVTTQGLPARWASVSVGLPHGGLAHGVADGAGQVVVMFAWPEPEAASPGATPVRLWEQTWPITVSARFGTVTTGPATPVAGSDEFPDLCAILAQRPARLLKNDTDPLPPTTLRFGRELILRSAGRSTLLLDTSP